MTPAFLALAAGLALLIWSADRFVLASAAVARHFGMPPLLIGMVVIGFGTSAPEMAVSVLAAAGGNPGLALGNAYGSNITNIGLILGVTALIRPLAVHSQVLRKELPLLTVVLVLAGWQARDGVLGRGEAAVLLGLFLLLMAWTIRQGLRNRSDALAADMATVLAGGDRPLRRSILQLVGGLLLLVGSSRLLVWGAVGIARGFGMSDLLIGLTIVAVGTSLPEFASSVIAVRRGEHELALGNILGSNLFNTLAVVGLAGVVSPLTVARDVFVRDIPVMAVLTVSLFLIGYGFRGPGRINRWEGAALLAGYVGYVLLLATGSRS